MTDRAPSYMHGASDQPMIGDTIGVHFDRTVARHGDRPGLIVRQQGIRWTWSELASRVEAFAAGLVALGLQPGDRVIIGGASALQPGQKVTPQAAKNDLANYQKETQKGGQ